MPVINIQSAAASGQLAPPVAVSVHDGAHTAHAFDRLLTGELGGDGEAPRRGISTDAAAASERAPIVAGASVDLNSEARPLASALVPLHVAGSAPLLVPAEAKAPGNSPGSSSAVADGDGRTLVATPSEPNPSLTAPAGSNTAAAGPNTTTMAHSTPATAPMSLGSGPVLGAAVTDGLTLIADDVLSTAPVDDDDDVSRSEAHAKDQGEGADHDGSVAAVTDSGGAAAAALIPLVAAPQTSKAVGPVKPETTGANDKLISTSLVAKAPGSAHDLVAAADAIGDKAGHRKGVEPGDETVFTGLAANLPASAGAHRAGSSHSFGTAPIAIDPGTVGAPPLSAAVAPSGATETDAAAMHHLERLYVSHGGAMSSEGTSAFARLGTIGQDMGVALGRGVADGRDHVTLRLDPPDLGRIDVQLSFGQDGGLRAVVASDNRAALDLLRRDLDQLQRALADAGVRADSQSFHFSERQSGGGQRWEAPVARDPRYAALADPIVERSSTTPPPRRLRSSGLIDVFA